MRNLPKIYLCSFSNMSLALSSYRFYKQALRMGIFTDIMLYNECSLDRHFKAHFQEKFYAPSSLEDNKQPLPGGGGNSPVQNPKPRECPIHSVLPNKSQYNFTWFWLLVLETTDYLRKSRKNCLW
ncbi:hypothetical protein CQA66_07665 [Helicobacter aurati]|uniref:Uncharacterized protein n=1 Tax=Helicobacter aurati TaxID=137778 RepID=A0A3D8IZL3_9HELI|nr:hypothetical protein [Helicobacter aurati]RDU70707.1 hypothetical protein CQA66_07665 [Helicobacter aurati]